MIGKQYEALRLAELLDAQRVSHHQVSEDWEPYETVEKVLPAEPLKAAAAAELRRLHQFEMAYHEWLDKTEWVQADMTPTELGMHRADIIRTRVDWVTEDRNRWRKFAHEQLAIVDKMEPENERLTEEVEMLKKFNEQTDKGEGK